MVFNKIKGCKTLCFLGDSDKSIFMIFFSQISNFQGDNASTFRINFLKSFPLLHDLKTSKGLKNNDWPKKMTYQYNLTGIYIKIGQEVLQIVPSVFNLFRFKILFM